LNKTTKRNLDTEQKNLNVVPSRRFPVQTLLVEVFSIILGVLLALAVNQWRENRFHKAQAESALNNVSNEIKSNLKALKILHDNISATIKLISEVSESDTAEDSKFIPGLQLRDTACKTLLSTNVASYVKYETVLQLSETYSIQDVYKQAAVSITDAALNLAAYAAANGRDVDDKHFQKQFYNYFVMLVEVESVLLRLY
jgi:hypothetical protein